MKRIKLMIAALGLFLIAQAAQAQWSPAKRLTWTALDSEWPAIDVHYSGNLYIAWHDWTPGNGEIYFRMSTDGGTNWTMSTRLTWNSGTSWYPDIIADYFGNPHVVWADTTPGQEEVYYKKSTDGGATWTAIKRLTWNSGNSRFPMIAFDSYGNLHVVWFDNTSGNEEIYYAKSTDGGNKWTTSRRLTWTAGTSNRPTIVVDCYNNLHVFWFDDTPENYEIYHKKSTDGGTTWTANQRLTWTEGSSMVADCAVDSLNNLHLVWFDWTPGSPEVFYKKSSDGGAHWTANKRLTWNAGNSGAARIAVDSSNNPHVVWQDNTSGSYEIYYKKSTDGGGTWTAGQRLTWISGDSNYPVLAVDPSGVVHVVWSDDCFGGAEIFYKRGN